MKTIYIKPLARVHTFYAFKKKWNSIAECCNFYGVNYHSVMSYKYKFKCDTEIAIQHYIDYKAKSFCFRRKKWKSIKECCEYYDINYDCFISFKMQQALPIEDALLEYSKRKKNRNFIFNGVTYNSFQACCKAYNVNPATINQFRKKKKLMKRRGLIEYLKYRDKEVVFVFANIPYKSFAECCSCYGLVDTDIRNYAKRNSFSLYSSLIQYIILNKCKEINDKKIQKELLMPIWYNQRLYYNVALCCEVLSIDLEQVFQIKEKSEKGIKEIICELDCNNIKMDRVQVPAISTGFYYKNNFYPSISVCCHFLDLDITRFHRRLHNKGETIESVLDFLLCESD